MHHYQENWVKQISEHSSAEILKFLVANKADLMEDRKVEEATGQKLADKFNMKFI